MAISLTYPEQLETKEWLSKRGQILLRDHNTCQFCGRQASEFVNEYPDGHAYYVGVDSRAGTITKDLLELDNIKGHKEFRPEFVDETSGNCFMSQEEGYLLGLTNRLVFIYVLNASLSDAKNGHLATGEYRVVRAHIPSKYPVYIYFKKEEELESINLPIYYFQEDNVKLNVHHKFYVLGRNAWEYEDSSLITLCDKCHSQIHLCTDVKVYTTENGLQIAMNYTPCSRCGGVGYFPEYRKVENGICFRCRGYRYEELIPHM